MSLALARKYRPKNFASVAVQSHVSNTLRGAIARGRVANGYLLCGPRGTGKTTLARVLAMALNCENRGAADGPDAGEPCGHCTSCERIWAGSVSLDVVEIDAASNRGVDDARELRERAMYAPSGDDRYKVYIVDEAHMLTKEAWNALLKILEEPPPRVVFVFCTTEPQKIGQVAAPILSRLQRFDLKRIGLAEIRARLTEVLTAEGVAFDPDALGAIARAADGGLRDALSLTDQVLSIGAEGTVSVERVREALGLIPEDEYLAVLDLVETGRARDVFAVVQRLADAGVDFASFLGGFADIVRGQLAITLGGDVPALSERARAALAERKGRLAPADLVRMLNLVLDLEPQFRKSGQQQMLVETLLVRCALFDRAVSLEAVLRGLPDADRGPTTRAGADVPSTAPPPRATTARRAAPPADVELPPPRLERADAAPHREPPPQRLADVAPVSDRLPAAEARATAPARPAAPIARPVDMLPSVPVLAEGWGDIIGAVRERGRGVLATFLEGAEPVAVASSGAVTVHVDDAAGADAIEAGAADVLVALQDRHAAVRRVLVRRGSPAAVEAPPARRITAQSVRDDRVSALRRKDPVLGAAIDALDLEPID